MQRNIIEESEFDKLPEQTQMLYLYCPSCEKFYLRELGGCTHE
jgi:hypothetical protein